MKYHRLVLKNQEKDCVIVNHYDLEGFDPRKLWCGERIEVWDKKIQLYYDKDGLILDYMPNVLSWLIFSDRLIDVLKDLNVKHIQIFPVDLYRKGNEEQSLHFNVVNVLSKIAAMNWEKSNYLTWKDDPKAVKVVRQLVMNKSAIKEGLDIFNLAESVPYIVVSEKLKNAIESKNITGTHFCPIEVV